MQSSSHSNDDVEGQVGDNLQESEAIASGQATQDKREPATPRASENESDSYDSESDDDEKSPETHKTSYKLAKFKKFAVIAFKIALLSLYNVYFVFAMMCNFGSEPSIRILVITCILYFCLLKNWSSKSQTLRTAFQNLRRRCTLPPNYQRYCHWLFDILVLAAIAAAIAIRAVANPYNLVSFGGLLSLVLLCFLFSVHPRKVKWYTVIAGIAVQMIMGILVLNVPAVYSLFEWLADRINGLLDAVYFGCEFVFGRNFGQHYFIFAVSAQIVYFGAILTLLSYFGVTQWLTYGISSALQLLMRTQPAESIVAATNIFLGQMNAAMVLTPVLRKLTTAEFHSVLTSGMATVSGSSIGVYAKFGIPVQHIIIASFMSAPAALSISRLLYPERKRSRVTKEMLRELPSKENANMIDAFSCGAMASVEVVVGVMVNVLVFVSALGFINSTLTWIGEAVCVTTPLSFESICSYLFWPLAFLLGVDKVDCFKVAELLGTKVFLNELVAYSRLGQLVKNGEILRAYNGTVETLSAGSLLLVDTNTTLSGVLYSERSVVISTYALCGFANFGSIGIMIGGLSALVSSRRRDITRVALRSMVAANVACFMTACVAGILYNPAV